MSRGCTGRATFAVVTGSLPEHTVDIWVASAIARRFPGAATWAPSPRQDGGGIWDMGFRRWPLDGKVVIFENKATVALTRPAPNGQPDHRVDIGWAQLSDYKAGDPNVWQRLFYVLPWPPWQGVPAGPPVPLLPTEANHAPASVAWLWVVKADALEAYLAATGRRSLKSSEVSGLGLNAQPLDAFLDDLADCERISELAVWEGESMETGKSSPRKTGTPPTPVAAFIPVQDLDPGAQARLHGARP